ncbi:MAG: DNA internalization-related competence protein ComEC/Rec2 [Halioglobus sp.]|nr:DNA internalization-related competence protein ComEC/Rec2 [Halioglobus sp.]
MHTWLAGLCAGLLLASALPGVSPTFAAASIAGLLCPAAAAVFFTRGILLFPAGLALGMALGLVHAQELVERRLPLECVGETLAVEGAITGLPQRDAIEGGAQRTRFSFALSQVTPARCAGPREVLLAYYGDTQLAPGQRWRFEVRLRRPWGPGNPGLPDRRAWFAATGIDAQGSVRSTVRPVPLEPVRGVRAVVDRLRLSLATAIEQQALTPNSRAVLRALTVGDKSAISADLWRTFQRWGIAHLLVISGLHIGLAAACGFGIARLVLLAVPALGVPVPPLSGLLVAALYAALAGFTVPVQRSLLMLAVFCLATALGRAGSSWHNFLLAAVLVLLINPLAGVGIGFWLSFAAVAALLWQGTWHAGKGVRTVLRVHLAMGFCMLPLGAYFFQGASLVAPLANLLLVPLVGLWIVPFALLAVAVQLLAPAAAPVLWLCAAWPLGLVLRLINGISPDAQDALYLQSAVDGVGLVLGLAGFALVIVPGGWRHRCIGLAAMLCCALPLLNAPPGAQEPLRLTVLDVGQGTAVLVEQGGRALLYDTGGGDPRGQNAARSVVLPTLRLRGITRLDTLVVSHGDRDHAAGVADILANLSIDRVRHGPYVMPGQGRTCAAGESWRWPGGVRFRFLSPAAGQQGHGQQGHGQKGHGQKGQSNNSSCVLQLEWGTHAVLLTGDIERLQERELAAYWREGLAARLLLAPHHGSNTSSSHGFLKFVRPAHLLVGNGYENRFGHPHPAVTARADMHGAALHETARRGAIGLTLYADGREEWQFYRDLYRPHWAQPLHPALGASL